MLTAINKFLFSPRFNRFDALCVFFVLIVVILTGSILLGVLSAVPVAIVSSFMEKRIKRTKDVE